MILLIELICLLVASFFAGMETGLLSADKLKIYSQKEKKVIWAQSAHFLLEKPERLLGTTLIGTNVAVVTSSVVLNNYLRTRYSATTAVIGSLVLAVIYLLFSEIIPKTFFRRYADTVTVKLTPVLRVFFFFFFPISFILNTVVKVLLFLLGQKQGSRKLAHSREDFRLLMHLSGRESGFGYDEFKTIDDILDFDSTLAMDAMIPLHQISLYDIKSSPSELITEGELTNHRYLPVYRDRVDNIIGYVDVEDFCYGENLSAEQILHEPTFFPEVKPLSELLEIMVTQSLALVFLCDEYGGISGIITHQKIASEIVGSIPGNTHTVKEDVIQLDEKVFLASGNTDLQHLSHILGITIPKGHNQTLGGYLCEKLGLIPASGTDWDEGKARYIVVDADKLHIRNVRIELR
ncbi:MAG: hemolysin family protein [Spirochaetales bacterium]|nr:hemolysin family protein [Spirochaetales bacterium]